MYSMQLSNEPAEELATKLIQGSDGAFELVGIVSGGTESRAIADLRAYVFVQALRRWRARLNLPARYLPNQPHGEHASSHDGFFGNSTSSTPSSPSERTSSQESFRIMATLSPPCLWPTILLVVSLMLQSWTSKVSITFLPRTPKGSSFQTKLRSSTWSAFEANWTRSSRNWAQTQ